ncbi:MAG: MazG nucleotide pyrophosphohydrolase domain-containing protein [Candidatus Peribacteraceae bacterium]|nr:MazG nucleotide pyrophosphohydrolase domain-containing protein [Candidatus Peribacteraceae bacterium]
MTTLKSKPLLRDIQEYILKTGIKAEFDSLNAIQRCLMLGEEVGELFKSVRKIDGIKTDTGTGLVEDELADALKQICAIANYFAIDLEQAFRNKERKNVGRWK